MKNSFSPVTSTNVRIKKLGGGGRNLPPKPF